MGAEDWAAGFTGDAVFFGETFLAESEAFDAVLVTEPLLTILFLAETTFFGAGVGAGAAFFAESRAPRVAVLFLFLLVSAAFFVAVFFAATPALVADADFFAGADFFVGTSFWDAVFLADTSRLAAEPFAAVAFMGLRFSDGLTALVGDCVLFVLVAIFDPYVLAGPSIPYSRPHVLKPYTLGYVLYVLADH